MRKLKQSEEIISWRSRLMDSKLIIVSLYLTASQVWGAEEEGLRRMPTFTIPASIL
jgi:hypothetical protein